MADVSRYDAATRLIHLLLALLGLAAFAWHVGAVIVHSAAGHPIWRRMA
jgi:hypothetical protein